MKRFIIGMFLSAVTTGVVAQNDPKVWAWDFPMNVEIDAKAGQKAVTCQMHYFDHVNKGEGLEKRTMIWYDTTISEPGAEKTVIDEYGKKIEVPNALIIPLGRTEKAKKGDILLTYHRYHDMQRAIVIDDSTPTEPVVCFLDDRWPDKVDSEKLPEKQKGEKLTPGSFNVLKDGKFEPGVEVAYQSEGKLKFGTIVNVSGDKVLLSTWASRLDCTTKDKCKLIPFKAKIKVGDKVRCQDLSSFEPGYTVVKVDREHGHIWVQKEGSKYTSCVSLFGVIK